MTSEAPLDKIKRLNLTLASSSAQAAPAMIGTLTKESNYVFMYAGDNPSQPSLSLLMRPTSLAYQHADLFPSMDMNLPEGFLLHQILERFPKKKLNKMHLLALMGDNAIGRVGYFPAEYSHAAPTRQTIDRATLLKMPLTPAMFQDLVSAYLSSGIGISGVQPKIMVPSKASLPIPDLIVKTAGKDFPGLVANEYLCLRAAQLAGIAVPGFALSDDAGLLVIDRFDIREDGGRIGFEDLAALMGLRVNDRLDNRKYVGSYQLVAETIASYSTQAAADLQAFFEQLSLSIMVKNGDAHLKNFGMLYDGKSDIHVRLSPMFDVVTTTIYKYERPGGFEDVDRTMALKLHRGKHATRSYPITRELLAFGREVCRLSHPQAIIERIGDAMAQALDVSRHDERIAPALLQSMATEWAFGLGIASEVKSR